MSFLLEYIKAPRTIGAVSPSGKELTEKMMLPINFQKANVIVEFGPGTGAFTRDLVIRRKPAATLILIEQNERFCRELRELLCNQPNLHIIHGNAEKICEYLARFGFDHADYIVSGLPFTTLSENVSNRILRAAQKAIGGSGRFITFQYTMLKRKFFERYFDISHVLKAVRNLPPANILVMKNKV